MFKVIFLVKFGNFLLYFFIIYIVEFRIIIYNRCCFKRLLLRLEGRLKVMTNGKTDNLKNKNEDLEKIAVDVVKLLLDKNVPYEDIQHLSGKSIEEIKRIGGITE